MKKELKTRFVCRTKNSQFFTYAVYDLKTGNWVADTEDTDLRTVEGWAQDFEDELYNDAPPHGSIYGEPCGDRK